MTVCEPESLNQGRAVLGWLGAVVLGENWRNLEAMLDALRQFSVQNSIQIWKMFCDLAETFMQRILQSRYNWVVEGHGSCSRTWHGHFQPTGQNPKGLTTEPPLPKGTKFDRGSLGSWNSFGTTVVIVSGYCWNCWAFGRMFWKLWRWRWVSWRWNWKNVGHNVDLWLGKGAIGWHLGS